MIGSRVIRSGMRNSEVTGEVRTRGSGCGRALPKGCRCAYSARALRPLAVDAPCFREKEGSRFSFQELVRFFFSVSVPRLRSPNKAPEPTGTSVTIRADARLAPAALVAHL
jgi:hypothetical protein